MNVRPIRGDDLTAIAAFLADDEERLLGRPSRTSVEDVRAWTSGVDLAHDSWLYANGDRAIRALGWVQPFDEVGVAVGVVHADARGRGLGSELVARAEARLSELSVARIQQIAFAADAAAAPLLLGCGYREVRRFWDMTIELDGPPALPRLPEGMRIEPFSTTEARAFHDALDEAFRDHWEHHSEPFEEWWERRERAPDFDPTLWFVVRDGDDIAAAVRNDPHRAGGGWVAALGVRRPWRGRGLGKALLLHSFGEFHRRGVHRVSLGVDADNPTGATKLYEDVGMEVELEQVFYEKELR
ncbi:MAG TPA: GNAT family N-acetyltransferase [Gaiellaceae bacterium]|nr:GNAT family N-acetyltransferase [Gaiellaceae bacterium]